MADLSIKDTITAIPGRFQAAEAGDWSAVIQFNFSHDGADDETWYVAIADGACTASEGTHDAPTATVITSAETWIGLMTGKVQAMAAFMTGKLKVKGNMGDVMKLNNEKIFKRAAE